MTAYPHNVLVSGKSLWPWAKRQVWIEDNMHQSIARPVGFHWHRRVAKDLSGQVVFTLKKQSFFSSSYQLIEANRPVVNIRPVQFGYWICESATDKLEVYHLGGSKSIISQNGSQIAIMSIQPRFSLIYDHRVQLRVNKPEYLNFSIAMALLLDDFSLHLSTNILPKAKVSTLQTG